MNTRVALALLVSAVLAGEEFPLTADHLVRGPNSRVRLTNTGNQPITAWALAITTQNPAGQIHREVWTVDGYLSEVTHGLPGAATPLERLLPGDERDVPLDPVPDAATVAVVMVVLDDGTAMGDEQGIASIFERRVKERDALGAVARAFEEVLALERGTAALGTLRERLTALVERDPSLPCRAALEAVETYQRRAPTATAADIENSLRMYAAFVTRERDVAIKHARRKSEEPRR